MPNKSKGKKEIGIKKPSNKAVFINDDIFFYEAKRSIEFVVWYRGNDGRRKGVLNFKLPFKKLRLTKI